jgi:hypothetical protein
MQYTINNHRITLQPWTYGMKQHALREATTWTRDGSGLQPDVDPWRLNDLMLTQCIVEWDLVDEQDQPLEITIESIHSQSPELIEAIIQECQKINGVTQQERKKS